MKKAFRCGGGGIFLSCDGKAMKNVANPQPEFAKERGEMTVVVFDMCASTALLSDLQGQGKTAKFVNLIEEIDQHLWGARQKLVLPYGEIPAIEFFSYKYMGDGWILLFPPEVDAADLVLFMNGLSLKFVTAFWRTIASDLLAPPRHVGLRFGVDMGIIHRFSMRGSDEYIGDAIVKATRLQAAAAQFECEESDPVLISKGAFQKLFKTPKTFAAYRPQLVSFPNFAAVLLALSSNRERRRKAEEARANAQSEFEKFRRKRLPTKI